MSEYNIQAASQLSGVSIHQLRIWEKRYRAVIPKRNGKNFRTYDHDDVIRLKLLGALARSGFSISKIANLETAELQAQYDFLQLSQRQLAAEAETEDARERFSFLLALLEARQFAVLKHELTKLKALRSIAEVLLPLLKRILASAGNRAGELNDLVNITLTQIDHITREASAASRSLGFKKESA